VLVRLRAREEKLAESKCSVRIGVAYLQVNLKVVQRLGTSVVTKGCSMKMRAGLLGLRLGRRKRGRTWSRGILEERSACYGPDKRKGEGGPGQQHRPGNGGATAEQRSGCNSNKIRNNSNPFKHGLMQN
jgi:hypothetical protein